MYVTPLSPLSPCGPSFHADRSCVRILHTDAAGENKSAHTAIGAGVNLKKVEDENENFSRESLFPSRLNPAR